MPHLQSLALSRGRRALIACEPRSRVAQLTPFLTFLVCVDPSPVVAPNSEAPCPLSIIPSVSVVTFGLLASTTEGPLKATEICFDRRSDISHSLQYSCLLGGTLPMSLPCISFIPSRVSASVTGVEHRRYCPNFLSARFAQGWLAGCEAAAAIVILAVIWGTSGRGRVEGS